MFLLAKSLFLAAFMSGTILNVCSLNFSYQSFPANKNNLTLLHSYIVLDAIQVTPDVSNADSIVNKSGRAFYELPFKLWKKSRGSDNTIVTATFESTFVLNIFPKTNPGGEGLAFILTGDGSNVPDNSDGQWLGIVNASTNGTSEANIVAIEFDTKKSYLDDLDDNHVGLNVNSIHSIKQVSLTSYGVNLSLSINVTVTVKYDGKNITVFASTSNGTTDSKYLLFTEALTVSDYLPETVFVGFSASTGNNTQLNCVKSWQFFGLDIGDDYVEQVHDDGKQELWWVWITVGLAVLICGVAFYLYMRRKINMERIEDAYPTIEVEIHESSLGPRKFGLKELKKATGNFNPRNKLGKGGFGTVYKGFLANKEVAIKRISKNSRQGKQEFIAEVKTIGSLRHKNLVKLIGWCYERREYLLVYEYMPNGSLDKFIFSDEKSGWEEPTLSWERRHSILYGVAQALDYLHDGCEKKVLHRDIKSSNVMLDSEFNARLGDFGLARTIEESSMTHHSTKEIAGTPGYMAPETFLSGGRATVETDIYAFGVLVLEVICGRKPGNQSEMNDYNNSIVNWLWELHRRGRIFDAVDSRLNGEYDPEAVESVISLGLLCCHPNPHQRPFMKTALQVLTGELPPPLVPAERPAFVWPAMPPSFKEEDNSIVSGGLHSFTEGLVTGLS